MLLLTQTMLHVHIFENKNLLEYDSHACIKMLYVHSLVSLEKVLTFLRETSNEV